MNIIFYILLFLVSYSCGESNKFKYSRYNGNTMGTYYKVIADLDDLVDFGVYKKNIHNKIKKILSRVNQNMSTYISDSVISRFNKFKSDKWFEVPKSVIEVLQESRYISEISDGAFDISLGSLVNIWSFGYTKRTFTIPDKRKINNLLKNIGYNNIEIRKDLKAIRKKKIGIVCDLSGISKGYAVDILAQYLYSIGIKNYLIDIGGEIKVRGLNEESKFWSIGIESPLNDNDKFINQIEKIIFLSNVAIATSGSYRNYFKKNGKKYSHTINPNTGNPIDHNIVSVSVIDKSCMRADALATAFNVMGVSKALDVANKYNIALYLIVKDKLGFVYKMTPRFKDIINYVN